MKKKGLIFSAIGMIVLFAGIIAGVLLVKRNQDFREKAAPASTLRITSTSSSVNPGDTFNLDVLMNTGENSVTGVDIVVNFDASNFEVSSITKGTGISNLTSEIRNTFDNTAGTVTYSAYTLDKNNGVNGSGVAVLRISMRAKDSATSGSYLFDFASSTAIAGTGEGQNVLIDTTPVTVNLTTSGTSNPTATATATATGTGSSATATPTATATTTGTGSSRTATPTATSTSSGSASSTPTGTGQSTVTSTATATATATSTTFPVPETGVGTTTAIGLVLGIVAIIFASALLAL